MRRWRRWPITSQHRVARRDRHHARPTQYPQFRDGYGERVKAIPVRRVGTVDEIAAACTYLASDAAGFVTGQVLHVNGGDVM